MIDAELARIEEAGRDAAKDGAGVWTLNYGLSCLTFAKNYLQTHKNDLIASALPDKVTEAAE